jgi:hypothetical protein
MHWHWPLCTRFALRTLRTDGSLRARRAGFATLTGGAPADQRGLGGLAHLQVRLDRRGLGGRLRRAGPVGLVALA